jgi:hypothetical protein
MINRISITLVLAITVLAFLLPSFAEKRLDRRVRSTLLEVQEALQNYHVDEELYPIKTPMTGAELIIVLQESGHLDSPPRNPWTGAPYSPDEAPTNDRIRYRTDENAETYTLEALRPDSDESHHVLDSTEHPSLE